MLKTIEKSQIEQVEYEYSTVGIKNGFSIMNFNTDIGSFNVHRNEYLDSNGNPRYTIIPLGFINNEVPKIKYAHRVHDKQAYTIQSYNIMEEMKWFITKMKEAISKGENYTSINNLQYNNIQ